MSNNDSHSVNMMNSSTFIRVNKRASTWHYFGESFYCYITHVKKIPVSFSIDFETNDIWDNSAVSVEHVYSDQHQLTYSFNKNSDHPLKKQSINNNDDHLLLYLNHKINETLLLDFPIHLKGALFYSNDSFQTKRTIPSTLTVPLTLPITKRQSQPVSLIASPIIRETFCTVYCSNYLQNETTSFVTHPNIENNMFKLHDVLKDDHINHTSCYYYHNDHTILPNRYDPFIRQLADDITLYLHLSHSPLINQCTQPFLLNDSTQLHSTYDHSYLSHFISQTNVIIQQFLNRPCYYYPFITSYMLNLINFTYSAHLHSITLDESFYNGFQNLRTGQIQYPIYLQYPVHYEENVPFQITCLLCEDHPLYELLPLIHVFYNGNNSGTYTCPTILTTHEAAPLINDEHPVSLCATQSLLLSKNKLPSSLLQRDHEIMETYVAQGMYSGIIECPKKKKTQFIDLYDDALPETCSVWVSEDMHECSTNKTTRVKESISCCPYVTILFNTIGGLRLTQKVTKLNPIILSYDNVIYTQISLQQWNHFQYDIMTHMLELCIIHVNYFIVTDLLVLVSCHHMYYTIYHMCSVFHILLETILSYLVNDDIVVLYLKNDLMIIQRMFPFTIQRVSFKRYFQAIQCLQHHVKHVYVISIGLFMYCHQWCQHLGQLNNNKHSMFVPNKTYNHCHNDLINLLTTFQQYNVVSFLCEDKNSVIVIYSSHNDYDDTQIRQSCHLYQQLYQRDDIYNFKQCYVRRLQQHGWISLFNVYLIQQKHLNKFYTTSHTTCNNCIFQQLLESLVNVIKSTHAIRHDLWGAPYLFLCYLSSSSLAEIYNQWDIIFRPAIIHLIQYIAHGIHAYHLTRLHDITNVVDDITALVFKMIDDSVPYPLQHRHFIKMNISMPKTPHLFLRSTSLQLHLSQMMTHLILHYKKIILDQSFYCKVFHYVHFLNHLSPIQHVIQALKYLMNRHSVEKQVLESLHHQTTHNVPFVTIKHHHDHQLSFHQLKYEWCTFFSRQPYIFECFNILFRFQENEHVCINGPPLPFHTVLSQQHDHPMCIMLKQECIHQLHLERQHLHHLFQLMQSISNWDNLNILHLKTHIKTHYTFPDFQFLRQLFFIMKRQLLHNIHFITEDDMMETTLNRLNRLHQSHDHACNLSEYYTQLYRALLLGQEFFLMNWKLIHLGYVRLLLEMFVKETWRCKHMKLCSDLMKVICCIKQMKSQSSTTPATTTLSHSTCCSIIQLPLNIQIKTDSLLHMFKSVYVYKVDCIDDFYTLGPVLGIGGEGYVKICIPSQIIRYFNIEYNHIDWDKARSYNRQFHASKKHWEKSTHVCETMCPDSDSQDLTYAMKIIPRQKGPAELDMYAMAQLLGELRHRNVLNYRAFYHDQNNYFVLMDLIDGPELLEYLTSKDEVTEDECKELFYQILHALNYIHGENLIHRDVKLENFVCAEPLCSMEDTTVPRLLLIDFGLACHIKNVKINQPNGTPMYMAPELFMCGTTPPYDYDTKIDVWAAGVILCQLLTGRMPFDDDGPGALLEHITQVESYSYDNQSMKTDNDNDNDNDELFFTPKTNPDKLPSFNPYKTYHDMNDKHAMHNQHVQNKAIPLLYTNKIKFTNTDIIKQVSTCPNSLLLGQHKNELPFISNDANVEYPIAFKRSFSEISSSTSEDVIETHDEWNQRLSFTSCAKNHLKENGQQDGIYTFNCSIYPNGNESQEHNNHDNDDNDDDDVYYSIDTTLPLPDLKRRPTSLYDRGGIRIAFDTYYTENDDLQQETFSYTQTNLNHHHMHSDSCLSTKPSISLELNPLKQIQEKNDQSHSLLTSSSIPKSLTRHTNQTHISHFNQSKDLSLTHDNIISRPRSKSCTHIQYKTSNNVPIDSNKPFNKSIHDLYRIRLDFKGEEWEHVTSQAKDLVKLLLTFDPKKRPTASIALQHEWFTGVTLEDKDLNNDESSINKSSVLTNATFPLFQNGTEQKSYTDTFPYSITSCEPERSSCLTSPIHSYSKTFKSSIKNDLLHQHTTQASSIVFQDNKFNFLPLNTPVPFKTTQTCVMESLPTTPLNQLESSRRNNRPHEGVRTINLSLNETNISSQMEHSLPDVKQIEHKRNPFHLLSTTAPQRTCSETRTQIRKKNIIPIQVRERWKYFIKQTGRVHPFNQTTSQELFLTTESKDKYLNTLLDSGIPPLMQTVSDLVMEQDLSDKM